MYGKYVVPHLGRFVKIIVPKRKRRQIEGFVERVIARKALERQFRVDGAKIRDRFYTGTLGEAAVEEYLGLNFINWGFV